MFLIHIPINGLKAHSCFIKGKNYKSKLKKLGLKLKGL